MVSRRGWGLLLGVGTVLLVYFGWSLLQSQKSRLQMERFAGSTAVHSLLQPLVQHYLENRRVAMPGDVVLPAVPKAMGVKAWSVRDDSVVRVELDAKVDGQPVVLNYVPVVRTADAAFYDCVSTTAAVHVGKFCLSEVVRSVPGIPTQLQANAKALSDMPAVVSTSGGNLGSGASAGSVVVVPQDAQALSRCGFQCVKPQSCVTPRPLACSKTMDEGNRRWLEMEATADEYRGSALASRTAADSACEQSLGAGYKVLNGSSIDGVVKLAGGREYWVHNDVRGQANCWTAVAR